MIYDNDYGPFELEQEIVIELFEEQEQDLERLLKEIRDLVKSYGMEMKEK